MEEPRADATPAVLVDGERLAEDRCEVGVRNAAAWFWWIAALSLVNSLATYFELGYGMVMGLGLTRVADELFLLDAAGARVEIGSGATVAYAATVLALAGAFAALGVWARRADPRAFAIGMVAYALDAMLLLVALDLVAVGFHAFVWAFLFGGWRLARSLRAHRVGRGAVG